MERGANTSMARHTRWLSGLILLLSLNAIAADPKPVTDEVLRYRRCWRKLSLTFFGTMDKPNWRAMNLWGPDSGGFPDDLSMYPPDYLEIFLASDRFVERFAGFVNSKWQRAFSPQTEGNVPYYVARHVLTQRRPWKDVFLGKFDVTVFEGRATLTESANGLGYFRTKDWLAQHAGNEADGYKLFTAYRILQNTIGLKLVPAANNTAGDASATGRQRAECRGCHFEGPYALDKVARVLTRRDGFGAQMKFVPSTEAPQQLLDGRTIHDDAELVNALVNSEAFLFNTCRLAFEFVHGRAETTCEADVFDACVAALEREGTMQAALKAVVQQPGYCQ